MAKFVLPSILVCLVISNNVNWGVSGIEGDTDLNSLKDTVKEKIDSIADFDQFKDTIPIDEGERIMKEKCEKNNPNNNNTYNETLEARKELEDCARGIVNITELKNEINVAKPKGDIDMVFKKYCKKSPEFKDCMTNYTSTIDVCLDASEKDTEHILMVVTEALLSFVCHDEGDRIALFYSEGGPDCLMDKKEALQHCLNKSFSKYTPNSEPSANLANLPSFKFEEEQCKSLSELQACAVAELTKCGEPTPANIIGSLFDFVRRSTPCSQFKSAEIQKDSAGISLHSSISMTALGSLAILLGRIDFY